MGGITNEQNGTYQTRSKLNTKDASSAIQVILDQIAKSLQQREKVQLLVFETSEVHELAVRNGRNPKTVESITILVSKLPACKIGYKLKYMVK